MFGFHSTQQSYIHGTEVIPGTSTCVRTVGLQSFKTSSKSCSQKKHPSSSFLRLLEDRARSKNNNEYIHNS